MDINEDILNELMVMNALTALELVHNPCLSSEERGFVARVARSIIEADEDGEDEGTSGC